jgi:hypothetical protein
MTRQDDPSLRTATKSDSTMNFVQAPRHYVTTRMCAVDPGKFADLAAVAGDPLADIPELERRSLCDEGRPSGQVVKNEVTLHQGANGNTRVF